MKTVQYLTTTKRFSRTIATEDLSMKTQKLRKCALLMRILKPILNYAVKTTRLKIERKLSARLYQEYCYM